MSVDPDPFAGLFEQAEFWFDEILRECGRYGIEAAPGLTLKRGQSVLCYYDLESGEVHVSIPDLSTPTGQLQVALVRTILGCETTAELAEIFELLLPRIIAHELAHHFRHRAGLFSTDLWREEQVANILATAATKRRLNNKRSKRAVTLIRRAIKVLEARGGLRSMATDSHMNLLHALEVSGELDKGRLTTMLAVRRLLQVDAVELLNASGDISDDLVQRLERRDDVIQRFSDDYTSDITAYFHAQLGWMLIDLESRETPTIDEFSREHLAMGANTVAPPDTRRISSRGEICALFAAHRSATEARSEHHVTVARYFYKRYRMNLLRLIETKSQVEVLREALGHPAGGIFECWEEGGPEPLTYALPLAPAALHDLFPQHIAQATDGISPNPDALQDETDRRLLLLLDNSTNDVAAAECAQRLALLEETTTFRSLPAETSVELANTLSRIYLSAGETLIWEGANNDDLYVLTSGTLDVLVESEERKIGIISPGEPFGEFAFLARSPRQATVRAQSDACCLSLRASQFNLLGFRYPEIFVAIGRVLAARLNTQNRNSA